MLKTGQGVSAGGRPEERRSHIRYSAAHPSQERQQGVGVKEYCDGSKYEGELVDGLKHGKGKYTWADGQCYEGSFYKDQHHGDAVYCWPTGHKFIGKFYLNSREGYASQLFADGTTFQGLYHMDERFGPGVVTYPDGCQDVGLWDTESLLRLCTSIEGGFSLNSLPGYADYMEPAVSRDPLTQAPILSSVFPIQAILQSLEKSDPLKSVLGDQPIDDSCVLPPRIERYGADVDFLPLPPGRRRELDQLFHGELWEADSYQYQGYARDPLSTLPVLLRMRAHIHIHRLHAANVGWDVAAVLSLNRDSFGPKGPLEVTSERLIRRASLGDRQGVLRSFRIDLVHPNVADASGHTALIAATVNCHNDVINLLLLMRADIDKLNCEGMSALAVCFVLYYPSQSLHTTEAEKICLEPLPKPQATVEEHSSDTACSVESFHIPGTEKMMPHWAEALRRAVTGMRETTRQMTAMYIEDRPHRRTLNLLLDRGADPNASSVPMPVLFLAIKAADTEVVKKLLLCGARTDVPLSLKWKGLYPLHIAAGLPGPAGPRITEMLLHAHADPDGLANDQDDIYEQDKVSAVTQVVRGNKKKRHLKSWDLTVENSSLPVEGGRTALHVACQRDSDYSHAREVVALLVSHRASTHLLWSGHSALSLAIASGNDLAVEELLKGGADPNLRLSHGLGSALCVVANINYDSGGHPRNKAKLLDMLIKAGADMLMPVMVGRVLGTVVDYAHYIFKQSTQERETLEAQHQLLSMMGDLLRQAAVQRERERLEREQHVEAHDISTIGSSAYTGTGAIPPKGPTVPSVTKTLRKPFKYCYECGRSVSVVLTACSRCHKVFYCSEPCKRKAWEKRHKDECIHVSAREPGTQQSSSLTSQRNPRPLSMAPKASNHNNLKENYSFN